MTEAALEDGFDYSIFRPGRLVGGPYTNAFDLATLLEVSKILMFNFLIILLKNIYKYKRLL